jgi:hypothetical protein
LLVRQKERAAGRIVLPFPLSHHSGEIRATLRGGAAADGFVLWALQLPELGHRHFQLELPLGVRIIHATDDHGFTELR